MILKVKRFLSNNESTIGTYSIGDNILGYTLEDEFRTIKVKGQTRIPSGFYEVKYREVLSPLTTRYRNSHSWFKWHLELQDVPDFQHVYIHIGNTHIDTDGCLLVGKTGNLTVNSLKIGQSRIAFEELYKIISNELDNNCQVFISIEDKDLDN